MPHRLIKYGLSSEYPEERKFTERPELKDSYDVVIIGAGGHGLAAAYYLAQDHDIDNVAVLEKGYIGAGGTGRNTAIVRSNYLTPEGVAFYDESLRLFKDLSGEFDLNLFYSERGHLTLAHSDSALRTTRWRAEVNKHMGVDSEYVDPEEIEELCPEIDLSAGGDAPVLGALYHPPGAIARHDAVAWGYGAGADRRGVDIHQGTTVTGIDVKDNRVAGVRTNRGYIRTPKVLSATAGWSPQITDMVGVRTPMTVKPLQAAVTEPLKPFLDKIVVSGSLHIYLSQSSRGELVMGGATDPYDLNSMRASLEFSEGLAGHVLDLFPFASNVKVLRQWAGICDMSPDFAPIMGTTPVDGFYLDAGWGTWGFKATPIAGKTMAKTVAKDRPPELIHAFRLSRFEELDLTGEKGAASVGH